MKTIDMTPTWEGLMPLLIETAAKGVPESKAELHRLAGIVDDWNERLVGKVVLENKLLLDACTYLEAYVGDLRYVSGVSVGFWNDMGNGTPYIDPDDPNPNARMAEYIDRVEQTLNELREMRDDA